MKQFHFQQIDSTNDFAKELLKSESEVIVTADFQTKGRGRSARNWVGDYGNNVYLSIGLNHLQKKSFVNVVLYQFLGCLAVKSILNDIIFKDIFRIKYPNDIMALDKNSNYRKLSGVLAEHNFTGSECTSTVIGIGINVNQINFNNEILNSATSLKLLGYEFDVNYINDLLANKLIEYLAQSEDKIFDEWKKAINIIGKEVLLLSTNELFKVSSILDDGRLEVINSTTNEIRKIDNGDSIRYKIG